MERFIIILCLSILIQFNFVSDTPTCNEVPITDLNLGRSCFGFAASDYNKCKCTETDDFSQGANPCKEVKTCNNAGSDSDPNFCKDYIGSKANTGCISSTSSSNTYSCQEYKLCQYAEGDEGDLTDDDCKALPITYRYRNIHNCVKNPDSKGCMEKNKTCSEVSSLPNGLSCSYFEVSSIYKTCEEVVSGSCKEVDKTCLQAKPIDNVELNDSECNKYNVSQGKEETHICIKNTEKNECIEQYLCEKVTETNDGSDIDCSNYPVEPDKKETHICVKSEGGNTPCKMELKPVITTFIHNTIFQTQKTYIASSITNKETENIESTLRTNLIKSSIPLYLNMTSSPTYIAEETQMGEIVTEETLYIILGFSQFIDKIDSFSFITHLLALKNKIYSKILVAPLDITYNNYLRGLEQYYYANCTLNEAFKGETVNYLCEAPISMKNIKKIALKPDFSFLYQKNTRLIGISPIATLNMDNIQDINNNKYIELLASIPEIYIIDNSTLYRYETYKFNIFGTMNKEATWKNMTINLMINIESEGEEVIKEGSCTILDTNRNNYTLNCIINENIKYNLQSATSIIEKNLLIINFNTINIENNGATINPEKKVSYNRYFVKKSKGIGAGPITGIILGIVAALIALAISIYCLRKSPKNSEANSTTTNLKGLQN